MAAIEKHFVEFLSPGTFFSESTSKPIDSWDVEKAMDMARSIKERHGATPYGFRFTTRRREDGELDSSLAKESGTYYLGGKVLTLDDIKARNDPADKILIANMECNELAAVVENTNSWKVTQPLREDDTVLDFTPDALTTDTT